MDVAVKRLLLVGLGSAVVPLDTALNVGFPAITGAFGLVLPQIQWIVISYVLTYGSLMLGIGRLGDIHGHARVFRLGLAWSAVALLLCAAAPSYGWLLAGRVLQGVGAALVTSCGPALATGLFPEAQRSRALGAYMLFFAAGSAIGPALGGLLVAAWGWPALFWFRVPIAALALLLLARWHATPSAGAREPFDTLGATLLSLAIGTALLGINQLRGMTAGSLAALPLGAFSVLAAGAFVRRSRRVARPILAPAVFRLPGFAALNAANALGNLAGFTVLLFVPYHLVGIAEWPVAKAGLMLAVSPMGSMLSALATGWLLGRLPAPPVAAWSIALTGAGLALVAAWGEETGIAFMVVALLLQGAGLGALQVSYTDTVTTTLPRGDRGVAGSLAMLTRTIGIVAAASLLSLLFSSLEGRALAAGAGAPDAFLAAFRGSMLAAAALCAGTFAWLHATIRRAPAP